MVVNVLTVDDVDYLVSPRGTTQWVRNVRAAGAVEMGPRWHRRRLDATELADSAKPELLRRYLDRWYWEVKGHIAGLTPDCRRRAVAGCGAVDPGLRAGGIPADL